MEQSVTTKNYRPRQPLSRAASALNAAALLLLIASAGGGVDAREARVMVDQEPVTFWGMGPRVETGGRILVPLRGVFEKMGATVAYDESDRMVRATRGDTTVLLTVGSRKARVDGREVALDVPVRVTNGRVLIPLRVISEHLGASVEWDRASRTVAIDTNDLTANSAATEENAATARATADPNMSQPPGPAATAPETHASPPGPNATPGTVQPETPATNAPMTPERVPTAPVVVAPPTDAPPSFDWSRWAPWILGAALLLGLLAYLATRGRGGAVIAARNDRGRI